MRQNYRFYNSVLPLTVAPVRHDLFEKSIEAFEKQKYRLSWHLLLDSIHPTLRSQYGDTQGNSFHIPHGSVVFHLHYTNDMLEITTPFAELPEKKRIAILRQIASLNFSYLDLSRLLLQKDILYFSYQTPIKYCHPRKLYHVLKEICTTIDRYSHKFFSHFGCLKIKGSQTVPYQNETITYVYEAIQQSCREGFEALHSFEPTRQFNEMWHSLATVFFKISYISHPQGELKNMLEEALRNLDRDMPLSLLVADGKQALRDLMEKSREQIGENLYRTETFISDKRCSNLQDIQENCEHSYKEATREMIAEDYQSVCFRITHKFYEIYYYNRLEKELDDKLHIALQQASDQTWKKAAFILYTTLKNIMETSPAEHIPTIAA